MAAIQFGHLLAFDEDGQHGSGPIGKGREHLPPGRLPGALAQSSGGAARLPPMHTGGGALRIPGQNLLLRNIQRPAGRSPSCKRNREGGTCRATGQASVVAGRELGFSGRDTGSKIDGRRLRSRGANTQLNLKVTAAEKEAIPRDASQLIQDPASSINNIGEFVVLAVEFFRTRRAQKSCAT